jgi:predicted PurR-regulated permease PerM
MLGQLIDMAVVGVLSTLGLALLGIPLPLALGVLAGLFTFVPYLGAVLAGIPAVIVASTVGPAAILWVVLLYTGCHVVDGYLVSPLVSRRTVRLPPAVTVLSMAVLGELYGFLGVLIATPLAALVIVLVKELYIRDFLGTSPD